MKEVEKSAGEEVSEQQHQQGKNYMIWELIAGVIKAVSTMIVQKLYWVVNERVVVWLWWKSVDVY